MTDTTRKLIDELEEAIKRLPKREQKKRVASYLADAKKHQAESEDDFEPYSSFTFLEESNLDLPPDYSETYEEHLYGRKSNDDG